MKRHLIHIAIALTLSVATPASWGYNNTADQTHQHHAHSTTENTTTQLPSVPGTLWETDSALREGMQRIRDEAAQSWPAYQQHKFTQDAADALAGSIDRNVRFMINNCKLDPEADAALHGLLTELLAGASDIKSDPQAPNGLPRIVNTLKEYPRYFRHPGWVPLQNNK